MPLQATSGAASYDAFGGGVAAVPNYIEDVFSTYVYVGDGTNGRAITNNIDLSTKGGLVWVKSRTNVADHDLCDTVRGATKKLKSNGTDAQNSMSDVTAFGTTGFTIGDVSGNGNSTGANIASWTFRKQPKFFDVVTYTGDGQNLRDIPHNLKARPGFIIIKRTDSTGDWFCAARSGNSGSDYVYRLLKLNSTAASAGSNSGNTDTTFNVGAVSYVYEASTDTNINGATYVAYLFAHNAGGFGLSGTDNVISCGSFTTEGTGIASVNLGYEPQFVLYKTSTSVGDWVMADNIRQLIRPTSGTDDSISKLAPNLSSAEVASLGIRPTSTGFDTDNSSFASTTFIYIAIRRGPMKIPTTGTSVFSPTAYTATNVDNRLVNTGITTDMVMARNLPALRGFYTADRLRGDGYLQTAATDAEGLDNDSFATPTLGYGNSFSTMFGFGCGNDITRRLNYSNLAQIAYAFRRAPSFFDEVCYTGNGVNSRMVTHNLGVQPELLIIKRRDAIADWSVAGKLVGGFKIDAFLNTTAAFVSGPLLDLSAEITSTAFQPQVVGNYARGLNTSGGNYVAYLFATCAGVSKVSSYTGTGTTLQVDCGFTGGARFVLIKSTDSTGDWYVWDSARGIVAGNDPYLLLNTIDAEVTSTDYIDTYSAGFEISSTAPAAINASGGTFIFLAIA